jgi:hypothetical protein
LIEAAMNEGLGDPRKYIILTHESYGFYCGSRPDQTQVLIGLACPHLVAIFFDRAGVPRDFQKRRLDFMKPSRVLVDGQPIEGQVQTYNIYDERIAEALGTWQQEIGFRPGAISVEKFFVPDVGYGIQDYPAHFQDVLDNPHTSDAQRADTLESIREWDADGQFVLLWGNDYWLNCDGAVVSS